MFKKQSITVLLLGSAFFCSLTYAPNKHEQMAADANPPLLIHRELAQKDLEAAKKAGKAGEGQHLYDERLQRIKHYYRDGEYQTDIESACIDAIAYFSSHKPGHNSVIIFDIDDTAVVSYTKTDRFCFIWDSKEQCDQMLKELTGTAIKPVLNLYNTVKKLGYKTIFLSSLRSFELRLSWNPLQFNTEKIKDRLHKAGYEDFDALILKSYFDTSDTATWKFKQREDLALHQNYFIAGCVGDRQQDFTGGYTGHRVKLPNYLY